MHKQTFITFYFCFALEEKRILVKNVPQIIDAENVDVEWMSQNHRAFYRTLLDIIPEAFCVIDQNYHILFANNKSLSLLGFNNDDTIIGRSLMDFIPTKQQNELQVHLHNDSKRNKQTSEFPILRIDGTEMTVEASSSAIKIDDKIKAYICIARDITIRKEIEKKHQDTARRALLYLDLLAHDISNQLQVMLSSTELLGEICKNNTAHQLLGVMRESIEQCQDIIHKTALIERLVTVPLEPLFLCNKLGIIVSDFVDTHPEIKFHLDLSSSDCQIKADEFLQMLILAILENAIEHNPRPNPSVWIEAQGEAQGCLISISDNGPGIPDNLKSAIFDRTQRSTGIGLQMCNMIVQKYSGSIIMSDRIEGKPELGLRVQLWFPRHKDGLNNISQ